MQQRPEQPPEGRLIADAAERLDLSIREAARRAGISYGRWRQITSGVQHVSPGEFAAVHAPARTLARMAATVHVTAEQMEAEGRRPDAASIMRAEPAQLHPRPSPPVAPAINEAVTDEELEPFIRDIRRQIADAVVEYGPGATGEEIFGRTHEAAAWDSRQWPPDATVKVLALFRFFAMQARGGRAGVNTGLMLAAPAPAPAAFRRAAGFRL